MLCFALDKQFLALDSLKFVHQISSLILLINNTVITPLHLHSKSVFHLINMPLFRNLLNQSLLDIVSFC